MDLVGLLFSASLQWVTHTRRWNRFMCVSSCCCLWRRESLKFFHTSSVSESPSDVVTPFWTITWWEYLSGVSERDRKSTWLTEDKVCSSVDLFVLSSSTTMKPHSRERPGLILDIYKQSDWEQNANGWGTLYPAMRVVFVTVLFHAPDWNNLDKVFEVVTVRFHGPFWLGGQSHSVGEVYVNTVNHNHTLSCKKKKSSWAHPEKNFSSVFDTSLGGDEVGYVLWFRFDPIEIANWKSRHHLYSKVFLCEWVCGIQCVLYAGIALEMKPHS